ncbi:MAG: bacillithiol biosynthesis protein BshC, partial [Acidobacteriaceae bacterium]
MKSDCLEFAEIPHSGQLFLDYLAQAPAATRFYGEQAPLTMPVAGRSPEQRARIADILERQNEAFGNSVQVSRNIARLREGANVIVTGQQAGLFGGPLLAMLKTLTAIRLAEQSNAVPVFWIATTDHDLAEVDHVALVSDGKLHTLRVALEATQGAMVSRAKIKSLTTDFADGHGSGAGPTTDFAEGRGSGRELSIGVLGKIFPQADAEILGILESAYCKGERMGIAFARLWSHLFSRFGLL